MLLHKHTLIISRLAFAVLFLFILMSLTAIQAEAQRAMLIEDFDDGEVVLQSWSGEDMDPDAWALDEANTYQNSPYSLRLFGNTWKMQTIAPLRLDTNQVWQVSAYIASQAEIQAFGLSDDTNVLYYSFAGSQELNPEMWIPVYQGCQPEDQWNDYQLPVGHDWLAFFGYLPEITQIVYINDKDNTSQGVVYFDQIIDITNDLPIAPQVTISFAINPNIKGKSTIIDFDCQIIDPDSETHEYFWDFGDSIFSSEKNPSHIYTISDDHEYTVLLRVVDSDQKYGLATCKVPVESGSSSFPISINFVGDIMLARKYEYPGGIIPTQGVEAIFEPTKAIVGDAADITVANLECPLSTHWQNHPSKTIYFKGSPQNVAGLTYAGIDIVSLANNHVMDYLLPGMQETQEVLAQNNILFSGAGANTYEAYEPVFYSKSGLCLAFLAASDRTGQYNNYQPYLDAGYNKAGFANLDYYNLTQQIKEVRSHADLVIMEFHAGIEYSFHPENIADARFAENNGQDEGYDPRATAPEKSQREIRQFAIRQGADLIICHHPHIMQGVELYQGKLIAHSLGDFAFDLDYPETYPSFVLKAEADETGFSKFILSPVYIDDYIPRPALGDLGLHILYDLAESSRRMNTYLIIDHELGVAEIMTDTTNISISATENTAKLPLEEENDLLLSPPLAIEKTSSLASVNYVKPSGEYAFRPGREEIWFGNMENEGSTLWNLNSSDEGYCDTVAYEGSRSIQHQRIFSSPSNIVTNLENRLLCAFDTLSYSLCGYIKTKNGSGVSIQIQYYQDRVGGIMLGEENTGTVASGDSEWTYYHKNLTIPAGTEYFDIRLNSNPPQSDTAFAWFDQVSLVCWDNWNTFAFEQEIPIPNDYYFVQVKSEQAHTNVELNYSMGVFEQLNVGVENPEFIISQKNILEQNTPNPFNPAKEPTQIAFYLDKASPVVLSIYNLKGQRIRILCKGNLDPGKHTLIWDGKNEIGNRVDPGLYFYQLETKTRKQSKKCLIFEF